eukprot:TRINITY_DN5268_c0_g1_i2.p1 TRINITY_DN5268_c0_g1~~TRINITY_DN5268_c0_g1_i2.p1  ORF type:complete len:183 (-),score=53.44 TRINITY_DN5268_c0_g1_i2:37-585(-)
MEFKEESKPVLEEASGNTPESSAQTPPSDEQTMRVRFVNVTDLMVLDVCNRDHPNALDDKAFHGIFTEDKPVIFNFHGYPSIVHQLLFGRNRANRIHVLGYIEEGTTTTPFDMLLRNEVSRFHIAIRALQKVSETNQQIGLDSHLLISKYREVIREHGDYIVRYGKDPEEYATGNLPLKITK